ncbi:hypothetical protein TWF192_007618 [Orbilia oligospora]|nr:hypothetical protein TWF192_007618 [Orbilia oligospora]
MDVKVPILSANEPDVGLACQTQNEENDNLREGQILCDCSGYVCKSIEQGSWKLADRTRKAFSRNRPKLLYPIPIERCFYFNNPAITIELPESLENILSSENFGKPIRQKYGIFRVVRCCWTFRAQDSPLGSIYRMYEFLVADVWNEISYEADYLWYSLFPLERIPEPSDILDVKTYACIASLVQTLVKAYNYEINLGIPRYKPKGMTTRQCSELPRVLERAPEWAVSYPPLSDTDAEGIRTIISDRKRDGGEVEEDEEEDSDCEQEDEVYKVPSNCEEEAAYRQGTPRDPSGPLKIFGTTPHKLPLGFHQQQSRASSEGKLSTTKNFINIDKISAASLDSHLNSDFFIKACCLPSDDDQS